MAAVKVIRTETSDTALGVLHQMTQFYDLLSATVQQTQCDSATSEYEEY